MNGSCHLLVDLKEFMPLAIYEVDDTTARDDQYQEFIMVRTAV